MKIVINATILSTKPSGISVYALNMLNEILPLLKEHEVTVYTTCPELVKPEGARVVAVSKKLSPNYGRFSGLLRFLWTQFVLPFKLKKLKADKLYCPSHHGTFFFKKQIITILDLIPLKYPAQHRLQNVYFNYMLPFLLKRSEAIITISENTRKDIASAFSLPAEKLKVAYCGFDAANFFPREKVAERIKEKYGFKDYFLVVGATYPHKNVESAVKALKESGLDSGLLVLGKGQKAYRGKLVKLTKEQSLTGKIAFIDYAPYEDLPELYSGAKALLYLSLYEGFGLPVLEAMSCGCPVITSNLSSLPEVCGNAAIYVDPLNPESISRAMKSLHALKGTAESLAGKGLSRARQFTWTASANKVLPVVLNTEERNDRV